MVRWILIAVVLAGTGPAVAQGVDWRSAGGDLFGNEPQASEDRSISTLDIPRLSGLNQPFQTMIDGAAAAHGLDPKLLHALVMTESAYNPGVCSAAGACGLTQLMPATARELGVVDRLDPVDNLQGGADYLARQLVRFGDLRLALAAYNSGPSRVARLGRIPEIAETQSYVASVIECYLALSAGRSVTNSRQCRREELVQ